jgi:hypothetical protein
MSTNIFSEHWSLDKTDRNNLICMAFYISRGWVLSVLFFLLGWYNPAQTLTSITYYVLTNSTTYLSRAFLYIDCFVWQSIGLVGLGIWLVSFTRCLANMLYFGDGLGRVLLQLLRYVTSNYSMHCRCQYLLHRKMCFDTIRFTKVPNV